MGDTSNIGSATSGQAQPQVEVERTKDGRKVYRIKDDIVIEGRIQKPNAFYVLQRQTVNYDWAQLQQGFLGRIIDSTKDPVF